MTAMRPTAPLAALLALTACAGEEGAMVSFAFDADATGQTLVLAYGEEVQVEHAIEGSSADVYVTPPPDEQVGEDGTASWRAYVRRDDGVYTGAADDWLLWVEDNRTASVNADLGWARGWNVVEPDFQQPPTATDALALDVSLDLTPWEAASLGGDWTTPMDDLRIALLPLDAALGTALVDTSFAEFTATDPWRVVAQGERPPDDHFRALRSAGDDVEVEVEGAPEVPVAYEDADASGSWTPGDRERAWACGESGPVALVWVDPAETIGAAQDVHDIGTGTGWNALAIVDADRVEVGGRLSTEEAASATMGECSAR